MMLPSGTKPRQELRNLRANREFRLSNMAESDGISNRSAFGVISPNESQVHPTQSSVFAGFRLRSKLSRIFAAVIVSGQIISVLLLRSNDDLCLGDLCQEVLAGADMFIHQS